MPAAASVLDASAAYPAVLATLASCDTSYATGNRQYLMDKGLRWAIGSEGYTIFNTIVTPNSTSHPWSVCKWGSSNSAQQGSRPRPIVITPEG